MCTCRVFLPTPLLKQGVPKCKTITGALNLFLFFLSLIFFFGSRLAPVCRPEEPKHSEYTSGASVGSKRCHFGLCFSWCARSNRPLFVSAVSYDACCDFFFFPKKTLLAADAHDGVQVLCSLSAHAELSCIPVPQGKTALIYSIIII